MPHISEYIRPAFITCGFITLFVIVWPLPSIADVSVTETYHYYDVHGNSSRALRNAINKFGRRNTALNGFDASTRWQLEWSFKYQPTPNGCRVTEATVHLDIKYHLPRWSGRQATTRSELLNAWDSYSTSLHAHELVHGDIAKETATQIDNTLRQIILHNSNCRQLQTHANDIASQLIEDSRQQHQTFDNKTNHGVNTGAVFP